MKHKSGTSSDNVTSKKDMYRMDRRTFVKLAGATVGALAFGRGIFGNIPSAAAAEIPGGSLDPTDIPKYGRQLVIPPAMPQTSGGKMDDYKIAAGGTQGSHNDWKHRGKVDYYEIEVRQFKQEILPPQFGKTTVWSYGSVNHPETLNYPAFTIEAQFMRPVRVKWINSLKDDSGNFLPHLLPVDPTLHWANPPGGVEGRDMRPTFNSTPRPYTGPVPIVTHLHGGHNAQESDGYPEAWYLPKANNIPADFAKEGTYYNFFKDIFKDKFGVKWEPGTATFQYENDQRATTMWYHDHTLGMTRLNVYAGPAGFYLLRGGQGDLHGKALPGPAPGVGADPFGRFYEIPIAIQDRSFDSDGSLFYPDTRAFFDEFVGPYIPESDVPPIWNPEFFGNTMVVNGRTWPYLEVEPRRYRFRLLNGCNSRFLILKMVTDPLATRPASAALPFWQIGTDGGFLPAPVKLNQLLMAPAERADVIVDFTNLEVGTELYIINEGPDEPFGGGVPGTDFPAADPATTGQVMKLVVVPLESKDKSKAPTKLNLPVFKPLGAASITRQVSLNEQVSTFPGFDGPIAAKLGILDAAGNPVPLEWDDQITENPTQGATEIWEMYNFTVDAHPIHIHEIQFQVVDRQLLEVGADGAATQPATPIGNSIQPESWETGYKDTVIAYPGQITRVKANFDLAGLYVWHCHILEHEDNEMMRPYFIGPTKGKQMPHKKRYQKK